MRASFLFIVLQRLVSIEMECLFFPSLECGPSLRSKVEEMVATFLWDLIISGAANLVTIGTSTIRPRHGNALLFLIFLALQILLPSTRFSQVSGLRQRHSTPQKKHNPHKNFYLLPHNSQKKPPHPQFPLISPVKLISPSFRKRTSSGPGDRVRFGFSRFRSKSRRHSEKYCG